MKDTKRALRRHHRQRMMARAQHLRWGSFDRNRLEQMEWARRNYDHLKVCSCWMCGNRRKWNGPTIQELRHAQSVRHDDK